MRTSLRSAVLLVSAVGFGLFVASSASAQVCGDADGSGSVTVTDGVQVLRAAADLPSACLVDFCDVDASGVIGVSDGVQTLRAAAALPADLHCPP